MNFFGGRWLSDPFGKVLGDLQRSWLVSLGFFLDPCTVKISVTGSVPWIFADFFLEDVAKILSEVVVY